MRAEAESCFALLDDCESSAAWPTSRLYQGFAHEHRCTDPLLGLDGVLARVDADQRAGLHAVLLADYEFGAKLLQTGAQALGPSDTSALRVLMFRELRLLSAADVGHWLACRDSGSAAAAGVINLTPSVDKPAFTQAIARIHEAIAAGQTYQVNYTYRLHGQAYGSPVGLYRKLRERQPVGFGALIELPQAREPGDATTHVLSCSPELFLRHADGLLTARPMKGTAARVPEAQGDSEAARHLSLDTKNRAENVMIVDLLRNDLGRIAEVGSVSVPALFAVEPYSTVFQMTSTVQARLKPTLDFADVLRAAFPCGSITGAPKHHTMQLIAELESTPRGLYCGAIGWLDAPQGDARCGAFCLSVAIRTLTLGPEVQGLRPARLGVGAGIVSDSQADDEFDECRLKARFLTGLDPRFDLFETLLASAANGAAPALQNLSRHLDRMARSAQVLGFAFDRERALAMLMARALTLAPGSAWRLRLALSHSGSMELQSAPLVALPQGHVTLLLAAEPLPNVNPLAAHKTTLRSTYDAGVSAAERAGAFDSLFFTADGRLVEGGRSSVFLKLDGCWVTPPLADGALPGVMRACLLDDPAWSATERRLTAGDLRRAEAIAVCNALRGVLPARLLQPAPTRP